MGKILRIITIFFALIIGNIAYSETPRLRPQTWAQPVISESLENWYKVDDKVFRSSQPNSEGMSQLQHIGITEVLNLRYFHSDDDEAKGTDLKLHRLKTEAGELSEQEIIQALKIITGAKGKILVHCWHGSDRTGAVIASYRVIVQGWSKDDAIDEMINGGYGFHSMYDNIAQLIKSLDVLKMRKQLDIKKTF